MRRCKVPLNNFEVLPIHTNRKHVWELIRSVLDLGGSNIMLGQTKCYWLEGTRIRFWIRCVWVTKNGSNGGAWRGERGRAESHAGAGPDAEGPAVWRRRRGCAGRWTATCPGRPSPGPAPTGTARDPDRYCPSYKSPQSSSPGLLSRLHLKKGADSPERIVAAMRWGLVPSWFKGADPSKLQFNTPSCCSDTITEKRSFKVPLGKGRRCVVLADGFCERQPCQARSQRQPYFIYFPQIKTKVRERGCCIGTWGLGESLGQLEVADNGRDLWLLGAGVGGGSCIFTPSSQRIPAKAWTPSTPGGLPY